MTVAEARQFVASRRARWSGIAAPLWHIWLPAAPLRQLASSYGGHSLRSRIEAPLICREVLPETYFLMVIMAADAQAGPFLQVLASCLCGAL